MLSKKIGLITSCTGSKEETNIFTLLGFHPVYTHRNSLLRQLHEQILHVTPNLAKRRLLEKAKHTLSFPGIAPPFQLHVCWVNAKKKTYSTKTYSILCATAHANCFCSFLIHAFREKRITSLGKICALGGQNVDHLPAAIKWNNNFLEGCSILGMIHISKIAMDQSFERQAAATVKEMMTMQRILLSKGKVTNITKSQDISTGHWIVVLEKDHATNFKKLIAGTITKLYKNGQISKANYLDKQQAPSIDSN